LKAGEDTAKKTTDFVVMLANQHIDGKSGWTTLKRLARLAEGLTRKTNTGKRENVRYAKVKSVEVDGFEDVYNLEVVGTHCFAVNGGLIVHNCQDAVRYLVRTKRLARFMG
jgi:hypothetical protein